MKVQFCMRKDVRPSVSVEGSTLIVKVNKMKQAAPLLYSWTKKRAALIIKQCVWRNSRLMGLEPRRIFIRDQHSRWGSCSYSGNLSFSFRIAMAPLPVMEYVVIHELVHLKIKNHSDAFWAEVEKFCPNYKERQRWLHHNAGLLHIPTPSLLQMTPGG